MQSIIVFSHLRWDFVYQRPQHLLSRLAKNYKIVFIEEPVFEAGKTDILINRPLPNLEVIRPVTSVDQPGFHEAHLPFLRKIVRDIADQHVNPVVWFYTPMALPLLDEIKAEAVVYDCMDELSAFRNPPARLLEHESTLLDIADIVFTGGPSLYTAKRYRNPNVHCFPSSVDVQHFRQALDRNTADRAMSDLSKPRLGFYGVIDERFDPSIISQMADAHPDWQIILAGPVVKINPETLPRQSNIHYLGQQSYSALPKLLAAWEVCLMPFAMNESTKFISPTKSLEYMAAELPIVSTPVKDVVDLHSDVVEIADTAEEFIAACERVLGMPAEEKRAKIRLMREKLSRTSWDATAAKMSELIQHELDSVPYSAPWERSSSVAGGSDLAGGLRE
jgi:glycosyltransferase involved in cell wall biosynthesis